MGYSIMGHAISLNAVRALHGSRNEEVYTRLTGERKDYVGYLMGQKDSDLLKREPMARALRSILDGEDCTELRPYHYGYAVVAYCHEYGEQVFSIDTREVMRGGEVVSARRLELDLDFWSLLDARWPLPIPETPEYPLVGWLEHAACAKHAANLAAICTELELEKDDYFVPLRDGFAKIVASGRDLIVFNY